VAEHCHLCTRSILAEIIDFIVTPTELECLWVLAKPYWTPRHITNLAICVVYNPPSSPYQDMLGDYLLHSIDKITTKYPHGGICIMGDFNRFEIKPVLHGSKLDQVVKHPTRGGAVLDLIITNLKSSYQNPCIEEPLGQSDHNTVLWYPVDHKPTNTTTKVTFRQMKDSNIRSFGQWISQHPWTEVMDAADTQTKVDNFYDTLKAKIDHHFPYKSFVKHNGDKAWMTPQIKSAIRKRQKAFHTGNMALYRKMRNQVIRLCAKAKKRHYVSRVKSLKKDNPAKWHQCLRKILNSSRSPVSVCLPDNAHLHDKDIAELINDHFSSIVNELPRLDLDLLPTYLPSPSRPPRIFPWEVYETLRRLNSNKSNGPDNVPPKIVKQYAVEFSEVLAHIFNSSLEEGYVPKQWKQAIISPIPKKSPASLNNLRPISLTSVLIKAFESFVTKWVLQDVANVLDPNQFGCRRGMSTVHYLTAMVNSILLGAESPKSIQTILLTDFSKAFDRINHTTLINKMLQYNVRPSILPWLCNFLSNRLQCVRYHGVTSSWREISSGVPQGTKLGPILFLIYINDALREDVLDRYKFVDDLSICESRMFYEPSQVQTSLDELNGWASKNDMILNGEKFKLLMISFMKDCPPPPTISLNDTPLEYTEDACILGLWFSKDLSWSKHVDIITQKASSRLFWLKKLKRFGLPTQDLIEFYQGYIRPTLEYAAPVWSPSITALQSMKIERVQKRALRIILGLHYTCYDEALAHFCLPSLENRRKNLSLKFAKSLFSSPMFRSWLPPTRSEVHGRDLKSANKLCIPSTKTNRYKNSPIPYFTHLLNTCT